MKRSLPSLGRPSVRPNRPVGRDRVAGTRAAFCAAAAVCADVDSLESASAPTTTTSPQRLSNFIGFLLAAGAMASKHLAILHEARAVGDAVIEPHRDGVGLVGMPI